MGNLYQLPDRYMHKTGTEWYIDGQYDRWGLVLSSKEKTDNSGNKYHLHLIRGTGKTRPE